MDLLGSCCLPFCVIIVALCFSSFVRSCTCPPSAESFEMKFCLADYSYLGDVIEVHVGEDEGIYHMSFEVIVTSIYHGMEDVDEGSKIVITTSMSDNGCGIPGLSKGVHLFQGRGSAKAVSICDYVEEYRNIHSSIKEKLSSGSYSKLCAFFFDNICLSVTTMSEVTMMEETTPLFDDYTTDDVI